MENTKLDPEKEEILTKISEAENSEQVLTPPDDSAPSENFIPETEESETPPESTIPGNVKKHGKNLIWIAAAAFLFVFLLCIFAFSGGDNGEYPAVIFSLRNTDDESWLVSHDGQSIPLDIEKDDLRYAVLTPDEKHIIVMMDGGQLYITGPNMKEKNIICENADYFYYVRDEGFVYSDSEDQYYRVLFNKSEPLPLGKNINSLFCADKALDLLYHTDDHVFTLTASQKDPVSIFESESDNDLSCIALTENAESGAWIENKSKLHILDHGEVETIESARSIKYPIAFRSKDNKMLYIFDLDLSTIWIKESGKETVEARLPDSLTSIPYTLSGYFTQTNASAVKDLYVSADNSNVYCISPSGDREKVLSDVERFMITDGKIIYLTNENDLYIADLKHFQVTNQEKISTEIVNFSMIPGSKYLFYIKGQGNSDQNLYCYNIKNQKSQRVASAVDHYLNVTDDGKTVLFFRDTESVPDSYKVYGTLLKWTVGDKEAEAIATEVVTDTLEDYTVSDYFKSDSIYFYKYLDSLEKNSYEADFMFFDGKKAEKVLSSIVH